MADVTELETRKGRGRSPATHLTTGEREALADIRADKHLYWPHLAGAFPGTRPEEGAANFDAANFDAANFDAAEITRRNDAESVTPYVTKKTREMDAEIVTLEKMMETCQRLFSLLKESGAFSD